MLDDEMNLQNNGGNTVGEILTSFCYILPSAVMKTKASKYLTIVRFAKLIAISHVPLNFAKTALKSHTLIIRCLGPVSPLQKIDAFLYQFGIPAYS